MSSRTKIAAAVAVAVVAGGGATAVAATTSSSKADRPAARYDAALASALGVDQAKLDAARKQAANATVDGLQADGQIDADRAAKLKAAIAQGRVPFGGGRGGGGPFGGRGGPGGGALGGAVVDEAAKALGLEPADLIAKVRDGQTPADIIRAAGKDPAQIATTIRTAVRERLQARVTAGDLTAAQADARADAVAKRLTADEPLRPGRFGGGGFGGHRGPFGHGG